MTTTKKSAKGKGSTTKLKLNKETLKDLRVPRGKEAAVKGGVKLGVTPTGEQGSCKCDTRATIGGPLCCAATWGRTCGCAVLG